MNDQQIINGYGPEVPDEDMPISMINLLGHVLIGWRTILIISLVCACVGGIIGTVKKLSQTEVTPAPVAASKDLETLIAEAAAQLTDDQKAETDEFYSQLLKYEQIIEEQKNIINSSYIMSLDPETAVKYRMQYIIDTDLKDPGAVYNANIITEDDYKEIGDILGEDYGQNGLNEAFSIVSGNISNEKKAILTITFLAPDTDTCDTMKKIVETAVERRTKLLKEQGEKVRVSLLEQGIDSNSQTDIANRKKDKNSALVELVNGEAAYVNNMFSGRDPKERVYMDRLRGVMPTETEKKSDEESKDTSDVKEMTWKTVFLYSLIGLLAGLILSIIVFAIKLNNDGKLHSSKTLLVSLKLPVMGILSSNIEGKPLPDAMITKLGYSLSYGEEEGTDFIPALIEELEDKVRNQGIKQIYFAMDKTSTITKDFAVKISEGLSDCVNCTDGGFTPTADEMKGLLASDCVILLPVLDRTKTGFIRSFVDLCRRNHKYIIGSLPIRDREVN